MVTPDNHQAAYTVVSVEKDRLVMTIKQLNGLVLDEFTIQGTAEPEEQETTEETVETEEVTTEETVETEEQTTAADEEVVTTAPTQTEADGTETDAPVKKGGCGSVVVSGALVSGLAMAAAVSVMAKRSTNKKKSDEDEA